MKKYTVFIHPDVELPEDFKLPNNLGWEDYELHHMSKLELNKLELMWGRLGEVEFWNPDHCYIVETEKLRGPKMTFKTGGELGNGDAEGGEAPDWPEWYNPEKE